MISHLLAAILLSSNASGKTLSRAQPGTLVSVAGYLGPLISDDAGTVAHVTWNGSSMVDSRGNSWATSGTVPQTAKAGKTPAGAGPFSDANYYSLGTGADVLDFSGDFSVCVVMSVGAGSSMDIVLNNRNQTGTSGWYLGVNTTGTARFVVGTTVSSTTTTMGTLSVMCAGRSNSTVMVKADLGAAVTGADGGTSPTAVTAMLGRFVSTGNAAQRETVYEVWASTTPASDALFTAIMQRVKLRAGITAW